ncbi:hypothetical protein [Bacillus sp. mrc49]|uniref:hypothetical protein n=1 Tax=Bacillus sp. mrc49 TaxID=2054913 RepID=UPI0012FD0260|nr:hypothetical protein [Bacillus sp. mrc49]
MASTSLLAHETVCDGFDGSIPLPVTPDRDVGRSEFVPYDNSDHESISKLIK